MVQFAEDVEAGRVHMVSSIAAAGLYKGTWREDMFEEAEDLDNHPYFRTKHDSEGIVRTECTRPWRVYRPGIVVGNSETGEMDKIDGPYYFFKLIRRIRSTVPAVGADARHRGAGDQPGPGRLRRPGDGPHRPRRRARRAGVPPDRPQSQDRRRGDRHLRPGRPRPAVLGPAACCRRRSRGALREGGRVAAAGRHRHRPRPERLRDPALGAHLHQLPDAVRLAPGPGCARRHRHPRAAARRVRRQALGLLGAPPRPGPLPRPHPRGGRAGQAGTRQRHGPDRRAADPRRAPAARPEGSRHGPRSRRPCAGGSSWSPARRRASARRRR